MGGRTSKGTSQNTKQAQAQTQYNAPPPWVAGLLSQGAADAGELYRQGLGGNVYQGARIADLSDETKNAVSGLGNAAGGFVNEALQRLVTTPSQAGQNLREMAAGGQIGNNNAAFNTMLQNALDRSATTINSHMSGAGRYGSGAYNDVLAGSLGEVAARAGADQYNRDVQNMLAANAQIDNANQGQLAAAGNFLSRQSDAYRNALAGGQIGDAQAQDRLDSEQQKWRERDNREWERLGLLQAAAQGLAGDYGTRANQEQGLVRKNQNPNILETMGTLGRLAGKR